MTSPPSDLPELLVLGENRLVGAHLSGAGARPLNMVFRSETPS